MGNCVFLRTTLSDIKNIYITLILDTRSTWFPRASLKLISHKKIWDFVLKC